LSGASADEVDGSGGARGERQLPRVVAPGRDGVQVHHAIEGVELLLCAKEGVTGFVALEA